MKIGMTDHYMILGIRKLNANVQVKGSETKTEFHSMRIYDMETFLFDMQSVDWK